MNNFINLFMVALFEETSKLPVLFIMYLGQPLNFFQIGFKFHEHFLSKWDIRFIVIAISVIIRKFILAVIQQCGASFSEFFKKEFFLRFDFLPVVG